MSNGCTQLHPRDPRPIAVFDSGLGGLTVVRHLRAALPTERIIYFGDTARVPYGIKSPVTVTRFALEIARYLLRFDPKLLVAACNTASALALDQLRAALPIPVVGVVEPGAQAAIRTACSAPVAVIGTEATIAGGAYTRALRRLDRKVVVVNQACPLFVPLVEEGRAPGDPIVDAIAAEYLAPLRTQQVCSVILGCTHYPLLRDTIARHCGPDVSIIDSGAATATVVSELLNTANPSEQAPVRTTVTTPTAPAEGSLHVYVSDNPTRFAEIGARCLGAPLPLADVTHISPEEYVLVGHEELTQ